MALTRSIDLVGYANPGLILNNANRLFHEDLSRSGNPDIQDGMDMVMCSFSKKTNELRFAGANLTVYVVNQGGVAEYRTDKGGISMGSPERSFNVTHVTLSAGDHVYISSDGYYDQFGGDKDKRLGKRSFRDLLMTVSSMPMKEQHEYLNTYFSDWKQDSFQVDDVCLIGFRA